MLSFAIVVSRTRGTAPPAQVCAYLGDRGCADAPFEVAHHLSWSNESGSVWFGGWQDAADPGAPDHHWHVTQRCLTAFAGSVWPRRDGWKSNEPWARQLARYLGSTPLAESGDDFGGIFVAASLPRRGEGTVVTDPLGIGLTYWGEGRDILVIASRAALAAGILGAEVDRVPARDAYGTGWLAYSVYAMGHRTGFENVSVIPVGARVRIGKDGTAEIVPSARRPWRLPDSQVDHPEEVLTEARVEMTTAVRMALERPGIHVRSGLTGGKDSRLVLAILIGAGLESNVEFQTVGNEDLPDVVIARRIAERFGLRHVVNPGRLEQRTWRRALNAAVRADSSADLSDREIALRMTTWVGSGSLNVAEPHVGRSPFGDMVLLSGACGEALRTNYPPTIQFSTKRRAGARFPIGQKFGVAGILRPEVLRRYREDLHGLLFDDALVSDSPQDVVDAFYLRNRLRRWLGANLELDTPRREFPLYSITAVRLAFAIGTGSRHAEWIHYQLIRQTCPELLDEPFGHGQWSDGADRLIPPRRYKDPVPTAPPRLDWPGRVISWTRRSLAKMRPSAPVRTFWRDSRAESEQTDIEIMRRYLSDDPSGSLVEIIDPVATRRAIENFTDLREGPRLQLYGALTAAIWLGRDEIPGPRT